MSLSDPFYAPEYFEFLEEIVLLDSDVPKEHAQGLTQLTAMADAGNVDAMVVLGRHFYTGKHRDMYLALRWYIRAAEEKHYEGQARVARLYCHPEDEETLRAMEQLAVEGYDRERVLRLCGVSK